MHTRAILRVAGLLLMLFSLTMLVPLPFAWYYQEATGNAFLLAFGLTFAAGLLSWAPVARTTQELRTREGFLITAVFYISLGLFGALPLWLLDGTWAHYTDAAFESFSGLTTTGATVATGLDDLPRSILFYRQQLQWLGGMGIIILAVAILPMLGVGGMQLYRTEMPGPVKDTKLTPRIAETAKALWYIYAGLTAACALAYWVAGMGGFDAMAHSMSTVALGGFSTHDASIGHFDSASIEAVGIIFMLLCGINFGLHFAVWNRRAPLLYLADLEVRAYLMMLAGVALIALFALGYTGHLGWADATRQAVFQAVSIGTTAGFTTTNFSLWPIAVALLIFFAAFTGGCAGSTGGGIKVVRVMLIMLQGLREIRRLIHPSAIVPVKLGRNAVPDRVVDAIWGFFAAWVLLFILMMFALLFMGIDFLTAFSAVGACLTNLGPGLGEVATHYGELPAAAKWVLCLAMLLGRLELFTLLVLLTPAFWRG